MNASGSRPCPGCGKAVSSAFCPDCGERQFDARALTLRGVGEQLFASFTSVDSKLIRSSVSLVGRPGGLTAGYLAGRRKPYLGPVALFLVCNVLFFATESLLGAGVFTTPLAMHLERQPWSPLAQTWVADRLAEQHTTLDAFTPGFDRAISLHARSWIIVMALSFAVVPWIVFRRRRLPVAAHVVFALHLYAFLMLLLCAGTAVEALFGGPSAMPAWVDPVVSSALLAACFAHLMIAIGVVYASRGVRRVLEAALLAVGVAALVLGYRFTVFALTLYTV